MSKSSVQTLVFEIVDDLGFAVERGRYDPGKAAACFVPMAIGPLIEMAQVADTNGVLEPPDRSPWIAWDDRVTLKEGFKTFLNAFATRQRQWTCPNSGNFGLVRTTRNPLLGIATAPEASLNEDEMAWAKFRFDAKRAAEAAGFSKTTAAKLVGAIGELEDNVHLHSEATHTGLLAFRAAAGTFEFVVADRGIGVLASLRQSPEFSGSLTDHGRALELALSDGCSRFGTSAGRGTGFRQIFLGLADLNGALRFRSGNQALTIDGRNPTLTMKRLAQKPHIGGFLISVLCTL